MKVVEGMFTTQAAYEMSLKYGVEMPVTEQLYRVITGSVSGSDAVKNLMLRKRRNESEG